MLLHRVGHNLADLLLGLGKGPGRQRRQRFLGGNGAVEQRRGVGQMRGGDENRMTSKASGENGTPTRSSVTPMRPPSRAAIRRRWRGR